MTSQSTLRYLISVYTGCSFAFDTFKIVIKSSFFVQNLRAMGHLKAKTWGFAIYQKSSKKVCFKVESSWLKSLPFCFVLVRPLPLKSKQMFCLLFNFKVVSGSGLENFFNNFFDNFFDRLQNPNLLLLLF